MLWRRITSIAVVLLLSGGLHPGRAAEKINIAVLDLDITSGVSETYQRVLTDRLRQELFKTGMFTVAERNTMENVLMEQSLHLSGCTSNECAIEVGRMLGVSQMVAGSVGLVGTYHTVSIRMIDVETTEVLAAESVDCSCSIEEVLTTRLREVADKLALSSLKDTPTMSPVQKKARDPENLWRVNIPEGSDKTFIYMEAVNIRAIGTRFGSSVVPGSSRGWFGSMGNGLTVEFAKWEGYRPVLLLGAGGIGTSRNGITYGVGGGVVGLRFYKFNLGKSDSAGFYSGGGVAFNTFTRYAHDENDEEIPNYGGTYGDVSGELFIGNLFDLHWNLDGRILFTFVELNYSYLVTSSSQPNGFLSLMTGIGLKLNNFDR